MSLWRVVLVAVTCGGLALPAVAQPTNPGYFDLGGLVEVTGGAGPALGEDGAFTRAPGAGGAAGNVVGWTQFRYGDAGQAGDYFRISAASTNPARLAYYTGTWTNTNPPPAAVFTPGTVASFSPSQALRITILSRAAGAMTALQITAADNSPPSYLALTVSDPSALTDPANPNYAAVQAQVAAYNARLNAVLRFDNDADNFLKPDGSPVTAADGTFGFAFSDYSGGFRSIDLTFSPVPEPAGGLAVVAGVVGMAGVIGRRVRHRFITRQ